MPKVILYSTGCPRCKQLEKMLVMNGIDFEKSDDISAIINNGFSTSPILKIDDKYVDYNGATKWIVKGGKF